MKQAMEEVFGQAGRVRTAAGAGAATHRRLVRESLRPSTTFYDNHDMPRPTPAMPASSTRTTGCCSPRAASRWSTTARRWASCAAARSTPATATTSAPRASPPRGIDPRRAGQDRQGARGPPALQRGCSSTSNCRRARRVLPGVPACRPAPDRAGPAQQRGVPRVQGRQAAAGRQWRSALDGGTVEVAAGGKPGGRGARAWRAGLPAGCRAVAARPGGRAGCRDAGRQAPALRLSRRWRRGRPRSARG